MKKKSILILCILVALVFAGLLIYRATARNGEAKYQFGEVVRGDLESTISCSGTLSPVTTVEVGTQVSGIIAHIYADFNDQVKKGQLLAVLDTVLLRVAVMDAQAVVEKAEAQLLQAQVDFDRNKTLFERQLISDADFLPYRINLKTQEANLKSAQATLIRAERNLKYAEIYAPISGTITARNVEEGQTVAASLSTPTLFVIAEDLSKMEILASVDESDIGQIKVGQDVRFDVQAYPNKTFTGTVKQIRLQPQTVSNVVTYTVVVSAANDEGLLLPGMTATVDFIIHKAQNVLLIPNAALRFQPDEKTLAEFRKRNTPGPDGTGAGLSASEPPRRRSASGARSGNMGRVWFLDPQGKLQMETIVTGMSDGTRTEIVRSKNLKEGMKVIIGMETTGSDQKSAGVPQNRIMPGPRGF
jgi:HlyD family secretion protein